MSYERVGNAEELEAEVADVLIHGYDSIDDGIVWRTIHESLPALRARVAALLDEMGRV